MLAAKSLEPFKLATNGQGILLVASSVAAIAVYTVLKQVLLFVNEKVRSIRSPFYVDIAQLMVIGGNATIGEETFGGSSTSKLIQTLGKQFVYSTSFNL